jgi:hypothetical protein
MINLKNYRIVELNNGNFALQLIKGSLWWRKPTNFFLDIIQYKHDGTIKHFTPGSGWFTDCQSSTIQHLEEVISPGERPHDVKRVVNGTKLDKVLK